jgi:hypothetical protein
MHDPEEQKKLDRAGKFGGALASLLSNRRRDPDLMLAIERFG